jgi:hypothetical protein
MLKVESSEGIVESAGGDEKNAEGKTEPGFSTPYEDAE